MIKFLDYANLLILFIPFHYEDQFKMNLLLRLKNSIDSELVLTFQEASNFFPADWPSPYTFEASVDTIKMKQWCDRNGVKLEIQSSDPEFPTYKFALLLTN